eukprot:g2484.t1
MSEVAPASKRRRKDSSSGGAATTGKGTESCVSAAQRSGAQQHASAGNAVHSVVMVQVPEGFSLSQAACSYGYFLVPPNRWRPCKESPEVGDSGTFSRPLRFGPRLANAANCTISQVPSHVSEQRATQDPHGGKPEADAALRVDVLSAKVLTESDQEDIRAQVGRMFQTTIDLEPWFRLSPEAKKIGYGRLFRSPTVFEDMVKSITGCNMKFQGTIRMNKLLCEHFGHDKAFPTPEDLEGVEAEDLKVKAKVGYRADRILRLAKSFRDGSVDPDWLEAPERKREEVLKFVKCLHGFGDYAAANVVMLLGFYEEVPMDSETVRHFKDYHGVTTKNVKEVAPRVKKEYHSFAPYQFLQYWYEMLEWCKKKRGQEAHVWEAGDFS